MANPTIAEIRRKHTELADNIALLLMDFISETGLSVEGITLTPMMTVADVRPIAMHIHVDVKL